jgi:glycerophosphoryl diester phosphodiesterase
MKTATNYPLALSLIETNRPLVIAHRGYSQLAPENTLPSFRLAVAARADLIELDVQQTKDNQLVVFHDRELDRTTDARKRWHAKHLRVNTKTAAEIQTLDAGSWFDAKYVGARVPLLTEALDAIQKGAVTLIERKSGQPATCLQLLRNKGLINQVVVQSFDWAFLRELHEHEPQLVLAALGPPGILPNGKPPRKLFQKLNSGWINWVHQTGAKVLVWNQQISKRAVHFAHARGLKVWIYTIDHPKLAKRLLEQGIDGLITNNPSLIGETIALLIKENKTATQELSCTPATDRLATDDR